MSLCPALLTTGLPRSHSTKGSLSQGKAASEMLHYLNLLKSNKRLFLKPSRNNFVAIVDLPEGEHQYKFCVDGQWILDPAGVSGGFTFWCH